ncbi:helix-turn-helix domain-containing protein [Streptomyces sp. A13(2022)]|uniref:helix-turn-helix domain-containing protein n=1 Tax=Streptomyces sp. A13(2022) TaxID=2964768 RepID=UPI0021D92271|nr:helix-turn-helix domain-containing protein [Streptomyces sp. A13(2022)]MCU8592149.1 helix-turn-helix domain-containing protein [Streptomyces sp. A13(2022)]
MSRLGLEIGTVVRHKDRMWRVAGLESATCRGPRIWLAEADDSGDLAVFDLTALLSDPSFGLPDGGPRLRVPQLGLLSTVSEEQRWRAFSIERHVREVETGCAAPGDSTPHDPRYDPASTTLAEREQAKADELTSAGWTHVSRATVRRWRARYRAGGVWGLVPKRRGATLLGRADPRVVEALRALLREEALRSRSRGWKKRMRRQTQWWLQERHGAGAVEVPAQSSFNKLLGSVEESLGLEGTVTQRRARAARPAPPFTPTVALRPGELVMLDSTPLDVLVMLDDGVVGRLELTVALDIATRSLWGVLRPAGTKLTDVAVLLAQMMTPMVMRPGWPACLSMAASVVPHDRLVAVDERLKDAAARPVIVPETLVVDQGKIFISPATRAACESLGISLQPVPPANGPAKAPVERSFGSIVSLFCQWLPGHTGSHVSERGSKVEQEPLHTVAEIQALFEEFLVHWHHRSHEGLRHPLMPKKALTPNQMWAALLPVAGYVPVPLTSDDFVELLPVRWQAITDAGIRFDYRTYDDTCLNDHRGQDSGVTAQGGLWEVHYNPYDPVRVWVRLPSGFREVPWIHATSVGLPFTHHVWEHLCTVVTRTGSREEHEAELALALDDFLKRAARKDKLTAPERRVAAKSQAATAVPAPPGGLDVLGVCAPSFGLAGLFTEPDTEDETVIGEDDNFFLEQATLAAPSGTDSILIDTNVEQDQWLL